MSELNLFKADVELLKHVARLLRSHGYEEIPLSLENLAGYIERNLSVHDR